MFDINSIITNTQLEQEGVWRPLPDGGKVLVARTGNDDYLKLLRRKFKANRSILDQDDDMAAKLSEEIMIEVYAHTILKGIKGVSMGGAEITNYTPEIGIKLLNIRDFRDKIKAYAEDAEAFRDKKEEEAVKN